MDNWSEVLLTVLLKLLLVCAIGQQTAKAAEKSHNNAGDLLQYRPGQILLAGLMRVHRRGNESCSEIQDDGIQAVETMNMIIDRVNDDTKILPGIKLGTIMVDTCDVDSHALKRVMMDILPLIWNVTIMSSDPSSDRPTIPGTLVAGVVGSASSAVSIQVANLLKVFKIPQVSYWSTSPDLSKKDRYKYFFRVVPSDTNQASAIIAFAKQQEWSYISVVYEDDFYGVRGFTETKNMADKEGICIATSQAVPRNPTSKDFDDIVKELMKTEATAVVVFTKRNDASDLMLAAQRAGGRSKEFIWIGSDGWSRQLPFDGEDNLKDETLDGSIGFTPKTSRLEDFDDYFTSITLRNNTGKGNFRNPWFAEYISKANGCSLGTENGGKRSCNEDEKEDGTNFEHLAKMESVADSVLAFVHALDGFHHDACGGRTGLCKNMSQLIGTNQLATKLYQYLKNLTFTGINDRVVQFDENQDGPASYNILNYHAGKLSSSGSKLQKWVQAGTYDNGHITWMEKLVQKVYDADSVCSAPCEQGYATKVGSEICCWHCQKCQPDEYVSENGTDCLDCPVGSTPDANMTSCLPLPITEMTYESTYGIVCICTGCFGLLLTLIVAGIYIVFRDTPIVKASGRELCFFVLFGVLITFLNFLSMTAQPTIASCVFSRIFLAIGPTCIYAALLTKTVRVVIIFRSTTILSKRIKTFVRPLPQILWTLALVFVQVIVLAVWFAVRVPKVDVIYPANNVAFRACVQLVDTTILVGLVYPFLLIFVCTILATINRNVPTGFNETQYIGFSMYTTCVIWLAFLPIFITNPSDRPQRIMTTSICLSLSATTVLFCLFGPRCFTILFHPEKNTQQSIMSTSIDKGGNPGSALPSSRVRSAPGSSNDNNNINRVNNRAVRRHENPAAFSPRNSFSGYMNAAMSATKSNERCYSLPDQLDPDAGSCRTKF